MLESKPTRGYKISLVAEVRELRNGVIREVKGSISTHSRLLRIINNTNVLKKWKVNPPLNELLQYREKLCKAVVKLL